MIICGRLACSAGWMALLICDWQALMASQLAASVFEYAGQCVLGGDGDFGSAGADRAEVFKTGYVVSLGHPPAGLERRTLVDARAALGDGDPAALGCDGGGGGCGPQPGAVDHGAGLGIGDQIADHGADQGRVAGLLIEGEHHRCKQGDHGHHDHHLNERERLRSALAQTSPRPSDGWTS